MIGSSFFLLGMAATTYAFYKWLTARINCPRIIAIHTAFLSTLATIGFLAFTGATLNIAGIAMSFGLSLFGVALFLRVITYRAVQRPTRLDADPSPFINYFFSVAIAATAGVVFFTPDLVPSSMTGDPARHFAILMEFKKNLYTSQSKPLMYATAAGLIGFSPTDEQDRYFVTTTIFSLCLVAGSLSALLTALRPTLAVHSHLIVITTCILGYPYFALQYGYYTLLLSSAFFFAAIVPHLLKTHGEDQPLGIVISALLGVGLILSHSFLLPALFISCALLTLRLTIAQKKGRIRNVVYFSISWLVLATITYISLKSTGLIKTESLAGVVKARGFVDYGSDITITIPLLTALCLFYFLRDAKNRLMYSAIIAGPLAYLALMLFLLEHNVVSPYYVNRIQLIALPVLCIFAALLVIESIHSKKIAISLALIIAFTYTLKSDQPLYASAATFQDLLESRDSVYIQNAINAGHSPLQFSARDRLSLIRIGNKRGDCMIDEFSKIPVIGTDHQTIWTGHYIKKYPSLFERFDMFVGGYDYLENINLWIDKDSQSTNLILIKHMNYTLPKSELQRIERHGAKICDGDSFAIYKRSPV